MGTTTDPLKSVKDRLAKAAADNIDRFTFKGIDFLIKPGVFPPTHFQSTAIFTEEMHYPKGGAFWEVGCGAGVTAVVAALSGCKRVLASDISRDAVENASLNAKLHSVDHVLSARCGNLFDVLQPGEAFDVIYWNSNFVYVPCDYHFESDIYKAFADAGYKSHARFLEEAPKYLTKDGKIFLGFSTQGNESELLQMLSRYNYDCRTTASRYSTGSNVYRYDIVELIPR